MALVLAWTVPGLLRKNYYYEEVKAADESYKNTNRLKYKGTL